MLYQLGLTHEKLVTMTSVAGVNNQKIWFLDAGHVVLQILRNQVDL